jgi:hypothetical protein
VSGGSAGCPWSARSLASARGLSAFPVHRRNFVRQSDIAFVNKQLENIRKNRSFGENL